MKRIMLVLLLILTVVVVVVFILWKSHKEKEIGYREACIGNLANIDGAKDLYAMKYGKTNGWFWQSDEAAFRDLIEREKIIPYYLRCAKLKRIACLSNTVASYSVNAVGEPASCKIHLHSRP